MMMCHPDKVTRESEPDKIYISNRCFAALNDAFNDYKNEPGVNIWYSKNSSKYTYK